MGKGGRLLRAAHCLAAVAASIGGAVGLTAPAAARLRVVYTSIEGAASGHWQLHPTLREVRLGGGGDRRFPLNFARVADPACEFDVLEPAASVLQHRLVFTASNLCLAPEGGNPGIYSAPLGGGVVQVIEDGESTYPTGGAAFSPSGRHVAFTFTSHVGSAPLVVTRTDGSERRRLTFARGAFDTQPTWSPGGHIYFIRGRRDRSDIGFDRLIGRLDVIGWRGGRARRVLSRRRFAWPRISPNGRWLALMGLRHGRSTLYLMSTRTHRLRRLSSGRHDDVTPSWCPGGHALVFARGTKTRHHLAVVNVKRGTVRRIRGTARARNQEESICVRVRGSGRASLLTGRGTGSRPGRPRNPGRR